MQNCRQRQIGIDWLVDRIRDRIGFLEIERLTYNYTSKGEWDFIYLLQGVPDSSVR